ncbi:MAG: L-2,4-diaminobutyric acid acetyltransferase [Marinobacterium sp. xm-d-530]|nr:MAG: L-2,4-diaminobutyric acid acetyltransferase [Marinobacterium sp. xm-d-530]
MAISLRKPCEIDGFQLHELVSRAGKLDTNSIYCNLLQFSHFSDTAIVAESEGKIVGSITGYRVPQHPETLFVWQVAVDPDFRGQGVASKMLNGLARRLVKSGVSHIETTITADNIASQRLFKRFFESVGRDPYTSTPFFEAQTHFHNHAPTEHLYRCDISRLSN